MMIHRPSVSSVAPGEYGCDLSSFLRPKNHRSAPTAYGVGDITLGPVIFRVLDVSKSSASRIDVTCEVPDRDSGVPVALCFNVNLTAEQQALPIEEQVRAAILMAMQHEVNEQIYKSGERVFDPHKPTELTFTMTF